MFKLDDKTKQKIVEMIFVIEDDNSGKKDRFKEIKLKYNEKSIFNKLKLYFKKLDS